MFLIFCTLFSCKKSIKFKRETIDGELNSVTFYTGYKESVTNSRTVLLISGSSRISTVEKFINNNYSEVYNTSIVYSEKTYFKDRLSYSEYDDRQQKMHDIETIIHYLISIGVKEILVLADAEGSMLAPEITRKYSDYIVGLISISGSIDTLRSGLTYYSQNNSREGLSITQPELKGALSTIDNDPENSESGFLNLSNKFWSSYLDYEPFKDLLEVSCPVLYINGNNDILDFNKQKTYIDTLKTEGVKIEMIKYNKIGHNLSTLDKEIVIESLKWVESNNIFKK